MRQRIPMNWFKARALRLKNVVRHKDFPPPACGVYGKFFVAFGLMMALTGCANYAKNAPLYQRNVTLENQNAALKRQLATEQTRVSALNTQLAAKTPRIATLPQNRLDQLFTVSGINISGDTRSSRLGNHKELRGFRIFVRTRMAGGMALPATGRFVLEAFDLAKAQGSQRIGQWVFTPGESKKDWYGLFGINAFAFDCPWKTPPSHRHITFKATFTDALTGRLFTAQRLVKIRIK